MGVFSPAGSGPGSVPNTRRASSTSALQQQQSKPQEEQEEDPPRPSIQAATAHPMIGLPLPGLPLFPGAPPGAPAADGVVVGATSVMGVWTLGLGLLGDSESRSIVPSSSSFSSRDVLDINGRSSHVQHTPLSLSVHGVLEILSHWDRWNRQYARIPRLSYLHTSFFLYICLAKTLHPCTVSEAKASPLSKRTSFDKLLLYHVVHLYVVLFCRGWWNT